MGEGRRGEVLVGVLLRVHVRIRRQSRVRTVRPSLLQGVCAGVSRGRVCVQSGGVRVHSGGTVRGSDPRLHPPPGL